MARGQAGGDFVESTPDVQESQLQRMAQRWRLVLRTVFLVLALLVWLAVADDSAHGRRLTLSAVAERDSNLATAVEHYIVRVLRTARAVHGLLGGMLARGASEAELAQVLADRLRANDTFHELGLCLPDGRVLAALTPEAHLTPENCKRIAAAVRPGAEVSVLPPLREAGELQLPLAMALQDDTGRLLAVAVALTPVESLLGIMQSAVLRDDTVVLVTASDTTARAAWRSHTGHVLQEAGFAALAGLPRAAGSTATVGDREYRVSMRAMQEGALRVYVASATEDVLAAFHARRARTIVLAVLVTLGLAAVYHLLSRMHAQSLARARALTRARAQLQGLNEELDTQVQERTAQLEQAYRDLETFSYAVAHDVRAPLASISGFAAALEPVLAAGGNDKHLHYLRRIQANAAQMDELTGQLLELGRLTRAPLLRTAVDLSEIAADVLARLREGAPQREVATQVEPGLVVQGDRALLRQVLENLLGNAWKFTSQQPSAHISVARAVHEDASGATFVVSDDGAGFNSEQAPGLFQPFRRMHGSDEFPGTGVGLAAVQRIIALHGGRVWCRSKPGMGAQFFVTLPA